MNIAPLGLELPGTEINEVAAKLPAIAFAALLGLFIFFAIGFASPQQIHNAAHDGRHIMAFPCH
jgi:cobalt transporter subunit CbtB